MQHDKNALILDENDFVAMAEYAGADPIRARGVFNLVFKIAPEAETQD